MKQSTSSLPAYLLWEFITEKCVKLLSTYNLVMKIVSVRKHKKGYWSTCITFTEIVNL
jgi:hypothetical protein